MTVQEMRHYLGVNRQTFSEQYQIPLQTLEDWEEERQTPPPYVLFLLERAVLEDKDTMLKEYAAQKLYQHIGHSIKEQKWDIEYGYLTNQIGKDGKDYLWYKDGILSAAIRICDGELIDDQEEIKQLFSDSDLAALLGNDYLSF